MTKVLRGIDKLDGRTIEVPVSDLSTARFLKFDFSFDTPDLDQGVDIYKPNVGDWLYNVWFDVIVPFDNDDPPRNPALADVCVLESNGNGLGGNIYGPYNLDDGITPVNGLSNDTRTGQGSFLAAGGPNRVLPAKFITDDPLKLYVTQNGKCTGNGVPIDSTIGKASVLAIVLPVR